MALPKPERYPAFNVARLNHIMLAVTNLDLSIAFWSDTIGLQLTDGTETRAYLRAKTLRGGPAPRSEVEQGSVFENVPRRPPSFIASPIIAP